MDLISRWLRQVTVAAIGAAVGLGSFTAAASAQDARERYIYDRNDVGHDIDVLRGQSSFRLFGEGDRAVTGMRPTGQMEYLISNTGIVDVADLGNVLDSQPDLFGCASGCPRNMWFDVSPIYAAPRSEWVKFLNLVPELANATGGGWAYSRNFPTLGQRELLASDGQFGFLFSGTQSTEDGGCTDFSAGGPSGNSMNAGLTLLASSACPPTWPQVGGVSTFLGSHPVGQEAFTVSQVGLGSDFNFDWWRVDPSLIDASVFFGNFQTYGAYDDYNSSMIERFGNVVPGGSGDPLDEGWPLGIRTEFDAFTFALPTVSNTMFWRAMLINNTEEVYGVPLDYDSLYVGYTIMPIRTQNTSFYAEVWRGAILTAEIGTGEPRCPGVPPPGASTGSFLTCPTSGIGFDGGVTGMIVLKSPIGDLRNVLLTCSPAQNSTRSATRSVPCPTDEFNDPLNPHAGDTITYNHFRMCPFGDCSGQTYDSGRDRQDFGGVASSVEDILNGRAVGDLNDFHRYTIFRNPNFPQQPTPFAFWVPGTWDYSANGTGSPDTLFVSTCYGSADIIKNGAGSASREAACTVTWSDTMPVGDDAIGNQPYHNQEGNISHWGVGPFALAAGDTAGFVIAMVAAPDSFLFESEVNQAIDLYMGFYLSPEAPPKVTIVGTRVDVIDPTTTTADTKGRVTLFWDDASDDFVDAFLEDFASRVESATGGDLARIRELNKSDTAFAFDTTDPGPPVVVDTIVVATSVSLVDRIRMRARDNLERILIYKSCDGGASFTADDVDGRGELDCDGDPSDDLAGTAIGPGWQAYTILPVDPQGEAPNQFVDEENIAGQQYLYVVLGETRGGRFAIKDSVDIDGDGTFDALGPDSLVLAPKLINPLATSTTESNVVSVYVPASGQGGSQLAEFELLAPDPGNSTVPLEAEFTGSSVVVEDTYEALFGNRFIIVSRDQDTVIIPGTPPDPPDTVALDTTITVFDVTVQDVIVADTGGAVPDSNFVVASKFYSTSNPNGVTLSVLGGDTTVSGDTILVDAFGFVLARHTPSENRTVVGEPLLVSTRLDGDNSTPPAFFGRVARSLTLGGFQAAYTGFPGFIVEADNTDAGAFDSQTQFTSTGVEIGANVRPTVVWVSTQSEANQAGGISAFGNYAITWVDGTFGPDAPFRLNRADPPATDADYDASLQARLVGTTGRTDADAAAAISDALGSTVATGDLVAVKVPFTVTNETFGRTVDVAMRSRTSSVRILGDITTGDTISVTAPADTWIPGDQLFFIEVVELDSLAANGGIALDASGQPITVQRTVATFAPAVLSCQNSPRPSCNPVIGNGTTFDWRSNAAGQRLEVLYHAPFTLASEFLANLSAAVVGDAIVAQNVDIRAAVDSIKVVPNPYIMFSEYEVDTPSQNDARLMFTHLPPEGTIRIFTVAGQFVQQLNWTASDLAGNGDLFWNMRTREGNNVAGGLYVYVVQAQNPATGAEIKKIGKFVVIR